jgi:hypothetical protein
VAHAVNDWCRFNGTGSLFIDPRLALAERLDRVVQRPVTRRTAQLGALRLAAGSPCDYRRLALRLQRQQTPLRPRRTHPNPVPPTVDHDAPTPSRMATGPPNGSLTRTPACHVPLASRAQTCGWVRSACRNTASTDGGTSSVWRADAGRWSPSS